MTERHRDPEAPDDSRTDLMEIPSTFEPAFLTIYERFQNRLNEARSVIDPMTVAYDALDKKCTASISEHSDRLKRIYTSAGLMRPTGGPALDRTPLLDLMDGLGTPEGRAVSTELRLNEEWEKRQLDEKDKPDTWDLETYWAVDEQILGRQGLFDPESTRHIIAERHEIHEKSRKVDLLRFRMSIEMRRMILYSFREEDLGKLKQSYDRYKRLLNAGTSDRKKAAATGNELKLAKTAGELMEELAQWGEVHSGPESYKKEAARRICGDLEDSISRMNGLISEMKALL